MVISSISSINAHKGLISLGHPDQASSVRHPSARVLPGLGLTLGYSLFYWGLIVLLPLGALLLKGLGISWSQWIQIVTDDRVLAAYRLTIWASFQGALWSTALGFLLVWVLVRYHFVGRKIMDALVDLPFALPTAVAGIALSALLADSGWIGEFLAPWGIHLAFNVHGIVIALIFIGIPFVVRTVQPILEDTEKELEDAAASLGANRWQVFYRVILPSILPSLLTGFALAFARGMGEYGSVIFIAGNRPMVSEVVPLVIVTKLEQYDYAGATAVAVGMLLISFVLLLCINVLQSWQRHRSIPTSL